MWRDIKGYEGLYSITGEIYRKCLCNFRGDSKGLTQADMEAELEGQGVDIDKLKSKVAEIVKPEQNYLRPWWRRKMHEDAARKEIER